MKYLCNFFMFTFIFTSNSSGQLDINLLNDTHVDVEQEDLLSLYNRVTAENLKAENLNIRSLKTHRLDSSYIHVDGWSNLNGDKEYLTRYQYDKARDTIINYRRQVGDSVWIPRNYLIYRYNENNQIAYYTYHSIADTTLDLSSKLDVPASLHEIRKYDNEYKQISYETRHPLDTSFVLSYQTYSYDNIGNLDSVQNYFYHDGIWTHRRIAKYYHSEDNKLDSILVSQYNLNDNPNAWDNTELHKFRFDQSNRLLHKYLLSWVRDEERFKPYQKWHYEYENNNLKCETFNTAYSDNEYQEIRLYTYGYDAKDNPTSLKLKYLKYFDADLSDPFDPLDIIYKPHEEFYRFDNTTPQEDILKPRYNYMYMNTSETSIPLEYNSMLTELEFDKNMECGSCGFTRTYYYSELNAVSSDEAQTDTIFNIYPNPTTGISYIELKDKVSIKEVKLYSSKGEYISTSSLPTIDLTNLDTGIYFIKVLLNNGQTVSKKIVKK